MGIKLTLPAYQGGLELIMWIFLILFSGGISFWAFHPLFRKFKPLSSLIFIIPLVFSLLFQQIMILGYYLLGTIFFGIAIHLSYQVKKYRKEKSREAMFGIVALIAVLVWLLL